MSFFLFFLYSAQVDASFCDICGVCESMSLAFTPHGFLAFSDDLYSPSLQSCQVVLRQSIPAVPFEVPLPSYLHFLSVESISSTLRAAASRGFSHLYAIFFSSCAIGIRRYCPGPSSIGSEDAKAISLFLFCFLSLLTFYVVTVSPDINYRPFL